MDLNLEDATTKKRAARRGVALYLALVALCSGLVEAALLRDGRPIDQQPLLILLLMWVPGLVSIVCRLVLREGVSDVSFRFGGRHGWRMLGLAWFYAVPVGLIAYGASWGLGLDQFQGPHHVSFFSGDTWPPAVRFIVQLALCLSIGTLFSMISAAGEELGWRGYMLTRLVEAGMPRPVLVSGLIWAAWHLPLIVSGQYAAGPHPILSACMFVPSVVAAAYICARVRLESGSVWPAVMFHAAWNATIQGAFDPATKGGGAAQTVSIWVGESGIFVVAVSCTLAALVTWRGFAALKSPRAEPFETLSLRTA